MAQTPESAATLEQTLTRVAIARGMVEPDRLHACLATLPGAQRSSAVTLAQALVREGLVSATDLALLLREAQRGGLVCDCGAVSRLDAEPAHEARTCESCGATLVDGPDVRRLGRYELVREIARGGMGLIYLARDPALGRDVALKVLRVDSNAQHLARLRREAELAAGLSHPSIITVHEIGEAPMERGGPPVHFIAMDYVEGETLSEGLKRLAFDDKLDVFEQMADAVGCAHAAGVIHRDLKPANVLLTRDDRPIVTDFGLARGQDDASLTRSGAVMGTVHYMAPEQVLGKVKQLDARADVWALGVILYEMLVGARPFEGRTAAEVYQAILDDDPEPPRARERTLPFELELICLKALEKEPGRRYADGAALTADVRRWRAGEPIEAVPPSRAYRTRKYFQRHPWLLTAVLVLLVAVGLGLWVSAQQRARRQEYVQLRKDALALLKPAAAGAKPAWFDAQMLLERAQMIDDSDPRLAKLIALCKQRIAEARGEGARREQRRKDHDALLQQLGPIARTIDRTRTRLYVQMVDIRGELAEVADALGELERLLTRPAFAVFPDGWMALGAGWALVGDRDKARAALEAALERPDAPVGRASYVLGRLELERALSIERMADWAGDGRETGRRWTPRAARVVALRERAAALLDRCAEWADGRELERALAAGYAELARRQLGAVRERCGRWLRDGARRRQLGSEGFYVLLGFAEPEDALRHWGKAIESDGRYLHSAWVRFLRGSAYRARNQRSAAEAEYAEALRVNPRLPEALHDRALLRLAGGGALAGSIAELERAVEADATMVAPAYHLGLLRREAGNLAGSVAALTEATRRDAAHWLPWWRLSGVLERDGRAGQAAAARAKARERAPADVRRLLDGAK